jgi:carbon-monoxide dehydrogenase medium subunit
VKAAPFEYHKPASLADALRLLSEVAEEDGRILAGGQSLVPMMAFRIASPAHLIDINGIAELRHLCVQADHISIPACVRHAAFEQIDTPGVAGRMLGQIAHHIAHHPIRVRGTFCGSLAHADPASEWCLTAATLDATLVVQNKTRQREIAAAEFFEGIMTTALLPDEMLVEARLPLLADDARYGFCEFSRRAGDFAIAMILVTARLVNGRIHEPHVGIGGVEVAPRRLSDVEEILEGELPSSKLFSHAAERAADGVQPLEDVNNPPDYRRDLVRALTRRSLEQAFA